MSTPTPTPAPTIKPTRSTGATTPTDPSATKSAVTITPSAPSLTHSGAIEQKSAEDLKTSDWLELDLMNQLTKALLEGTSILVKLDPKDFEMFGKMSSHEYRKLFFKVTKDLPNEAKIWIIILFTAIKSKPRVLNSMVKFNEQSWYKPTREFIVQKMVQYTGELSTDQSKFAAVHVPHIMPSLTAVCWLKITPMKDRTVNNFLSNLWACQMKMPESLMLRQKTWEMNFWNSTVKKTRNNNRDSVKMEFHEDFWNTKSADKYPFLDLTGNSFPVENEEDLKSWIDMWSAYTK